MEEKEVLSFAKKAVKEFPFPLKTKPEMEFLTKRRFKFYLDGTPLEMHLEDTPCFVAHLVEGERVYFCMGILKNFLSGRKKEDELFVKAITTHELFHIYNHHQAKTGKQALKSEAEVHMEIKKYFKEYFLLLKGHEEENRLNIQKRLAAPSL